MRPAAPLLRVCNITELVTATTYTCNIFLVTLEHAPTPTCRNDVGTAAVGGGEVVGVVRGRALSWVLSVNRFTWCVPCCVCVCVCVCVRQLHGRRVAKGLLPFQQRSMGLLGAGARGHPTIPKQPPPESSVASDASAHLLGALACFARARSGYATAHSA